MKRLLDFFTKNPPGKLLGGYSTNQDYYHTISDGKLELYNLLGHGNFTHVCVDTAKSGDDDDELLLRVVKLTSPDSTDENVTKNELTVMEKLGEHKFVLGLVRAIQAGDIRDCSLPGIFIMSSLCLNGSLGTYLKYLNQANEPSILELLLESRVRIFESVKFAYEIAAGMEYISLRNITYRNLSTHSVLLDDTKTCKICDFSCSRVTQDEEPGEHPVVQLSWRYVAPEVFYEGRWRISSDVWTYGVTIWEIFSVGKCPYSEMVWGRKFGEGLKNGSIRLPIPDLADAEIYDIMTACWCTDERFRYPFPILRDKFDKRYSQLVSELGSEKISRLQEIQPTQVQIELSTKEPSKEYLSGKECGTQESKYGPVAMFRFLQKLDASPKMSRSQTRLDKEQSPSTNNCSSSVSRIRLGSLIGYGNFNYAFIGYPCSEKGVNPDVDPVAVIIPKEGSCAKMDMDNEISIMRKIGHHEFILRMIGVMSSDEISGCEFSGTFIITELCVNRSVKDYLGRIKALMGGQPEDQNLILHNNSAILFDPSVRIFESVKFSYQIASGMEYISSKNIAHRDLSARNVLLDTRKNCKISDFGLSNWIGLHEKVEKSEVEMNGIPWRWIAPECFDSAGCSTSSDVWSYGVTIWEIFSIGERPYGDIKWNQEFTTGITNGSIRLPRPELANDKIYKLMAECWQTDANVRPNFCDTATTLYLQYTHSLHEMGAGRAMEIQEIQPTRISVDIPKVAEESKATGKIREVIMDFEIPMEEWEFDPIPEPDIENPTSMDRRTGRVRGNRVFIKGINYSQSASVPVVIKQLLNEIKMHGLVGNHPNILELVGIYTAELHKEILFKATKLCENGDLLSYLRNNQEHILNNKEESKKDFCRFSFEISSALEHLAKNKIVHVQVAARSVFLDANLQCKLHDFGLSRTLDDNGEYIKWGQEPLPWRWMAPESLNHLEFTTKSDVWGFGCLLYEIYSLGKVPHEEFSWTTQFANLLKSGLRLKRPLLAAGPVYDQMLKCCHVDKQLRPGFVELSGFFEALARNEYYMELYTPYANAFHKKPQKSELCQNPKHAIKRLKMRKLLQVIVTTKNATKLDKLDFRQLGAHSARREETLGKLVKIELNNLVGHGNFTHACFETEKSDELQILAVKLPMEGRTEHDTANEVAILQKLGTSDFVLGLIDTIWADEITDCTSPGMFIMSSLCFNGSLHRYLSYLNPGYYTPSSFSNIPNILLERPVRVFEATKFAYEIACGMEYISSKKIIHRNLSTHVVLLDDTKTCKISDFSYSKVIDEESGSTRSRPSPLSWKWLAPECFYEESVKISSDVWSYGVTVWEIYSVGQTPHADMVGDRDCLDGVSDGSIRLPKPDLANTKIYNVMTTCWCTDERFRYPFYILRDAFGQVYSQLANILGTDKIARVEEAQPAPVQIELSTSYT